MSDEQKRKPTNYDELFPGRFLKAGLLQGRPATVTISDVELELLPSDKGKDRDRGVLSFKGKTMQLVLNSTNGQCIKAMFGKSVQAWVGKRITLVPETAKFGGETVDAIRIKGSPDIEKDIEVEIRMPRKKPRTRKLVRTVVGNGNGHARQPAQTEPERMPAQDCDSGNVDDGSVRPEHEPPVGFGGDDDIPF